MPAPSGVIVHESTERWLPETGTSTSVVVPPPATGTATSCSTYPDPESATA